jgi:hypothetical protein
MTFVTTIKDYIDFLNTLYDSISSSTITLPLLIEQSFFYFFGTLKSLLFYFITFQWFRDLTYLPVLVPQLSGSIFKETYFLENSFSNFFTFLEIPTYSSNKFLIGFLNSFFLCLPISVAHIICARRLLIQGIPAGIASGLGTIIGQNLFLFFILFGYRFFIIPWLSFEPWSYLIGIVVLLSIISDMVHERALRIVPISENKVLFKIFLLNFFLSWTEQASIFQYFGNLTFSAEPTSLETIFSSNDFDFIIKHGSYLIGIFLGSLFFTTVFGFLCIKLSSFVLKISSLPYSRWINQLNTILLTCVIAFSFSSVPFYGLEYLLTGPFGFVSQDKAFDKTFFSGNSVPDTNKILGSHSEYASLDVDSTAFDRGRYIQKEFNDTFEELNYQGEYAWTAKQDHHPRSLFEKFENLLLNFFQNKKSTKSISQQQQPKEQTSDFVFSDNKEQKKQFSQKHFKNSNPPIESENSLENQKISSKLEKNSEEEFSELEENSDEEFYKLDEKNKSRLSNSDTFKPILPDPETDEEFLNLQAGNFSKQFLFEESSNLILEKKIKQKYYSNPVYKILLSLDIDLFLKRQPKSYLLSPVEEKQLFQKRLLLANYYDSLRFYKQLPYSEIFENFYSGSKSFADRIYNQQFKGTLKIVRRLFAITLNVDQNLDQTRVLKFDQPLYKTMLLPTTRAEEEFNKIARLPDKNPILHEELNFSKENKKVFLESANPIPFYAGWDEQLRKLVITNRLLPRQLASYSMYTKSSKKLEKFPQIKNSSHVQNSKKSKLNSFHEKQPSITLMSIDFTAWPLPKSFFKKDKSDFPIKNNLGEIPYTVLFEYPNAINREQVRKEEIIKILQKLENELSWSLETVPTNLKRNYQEDINDILAPSRGGFIWPGHSSLKFQIPKLFKT